jgi:hypothetical protein
MQEGSLNFDHKPDPKNKFDEYFNMQEVDSFARHNEKELQNKMKIFRTKVEILAGDSNNTELKRIHVEHLTDEMMELFERFESKRVFPPEIAKVVRDLAKFKNMPETEASLKLLRYMYSKLMNKQRDNKIDKHLPSSQTDLDFAA